MSFGFAEPVARVHAAKQHRDPGLRYRSKGFGPARGFAAKLLRRDAVERAVHDDHVLAGKAIVSRNHDAVESPAQRNRILKLHRKRPAAALPLYVKRWQDARPPRGDEDIRPRGFDGVAFLAEGISLERGDVRACDPPGRLRMTRFTTGVSPRASARPTAWFSMPGRPSVRHQQVGKGCGQVRPVSVLWGVNSVIESLYVAGCASPYHGTLWNESPSFTRESRAFATKQLSVWAVGRH